MSTNEEMEPMLTIKEVAILLHVHVNTVRRWSDRGLIKSYQINRRGDRRFRNKDLELFLTHMNSKPSGENGSGSSLP
jgi:excisionase family DNA binding protein